MLCLSLFCFISDEELIFPTTIMVRVSSYAPWRLFAKVVATVSIVMLEPGVRTDSHPFYETGNSKSISDTALSRQTLRTDFGEGNLQNRRTGQRSLA